MNDGNEPAAEMTNSQIATAMLESQGQPMMLASSISLGRIENKLVSADRTAVNEVLAKENADDWHVISAHNTGNHFDLILERTLYDEPPAVEPAPIAEENPAASSEASPV